MWNRKHSTIVYPIIKEKALAYGIAFADHKEIDEINILQATYEAMRARYEERYPIYQATAHHRIDGDGTIEEVANAIMEEFCK